MLLAKTIWCQSGDDLLNNYDYLYEERIVNDKTQVEMAVNLGVTRDRIRSALNKFDIIPTNYTRGNRKVLKKNITKEQLEDLYITKQLGAIPIAKLLNISRQDVRNLLHFYKIEIQYNTYGNKYPEEILNKLNDSEWLKEQYITKNRTCKEIGEEIGVSNNAIHKRVVKLGLKKERKISENIAEKLQDKDFIIHEYYTLGKSFKEIAEELETSHSAVERAFHKLNLIPRNNRFGYTDGFHSSFEKKTAGIMDKLNIKYHKQFDCGFGRADFFLIDYDTVLECDGIYWHSSESAKTKDEIKTKKFLELGYKVYRIKEETIMDSNKRYELPKLENEIKKAVGVL